MHGAEGHANLTPVILKVMKRSGNPIVGKGEIIFRFGIEGGTMREAIQGAVLEGYGLIDLRMVDGMLVKLGGRPGKHEYVVALACPDFATSACGD